jgi:hypothetical protein
VKLWCIVSVGRNWQTVVVRLQRVCWNGLSGSSSYGAACELDGTD